MLTEWQLLALYWLLGCLGGSVTAEGQQSTLSEPATSSSRTATLFQIRTGTRYVRKACREVTDGCF